jgi:integrase
VVKLVERFLEFLRTAKRSDKTLRTYKIPCRLLQEELGERTPLESITKERMEELYGLLRRAPSNATKRYRGLSLKQAVELADKKGDPKRLSAKSLDNYRVNIEAIFNFAVEEEIIAKNPAKGRTLRALMVGGEPPKPKVHFTGDEMNRLFRVSPFKLNESGKSGPKSVRRMLQKGRAWVCLLSLFHGFRLNEVAQLYTEDIKKEEGIPFIEIRKEREDGSESDKRIKTKQSKRRVPIHPELLKLGFLLFVEQRRKDASRQRLFPDLPLGASGYFSDPFSKWFSGFKKKTLGEECKATFHSFRHQFRDALREAGVSTEDAERLGGWEIGKHSAEREYGRGPSLKYLRKQIQKVKYPGLDLRHLQKR